MLKRTLLLCLLTATAAAHATTYYFDSTSGSDSNPGTSPTAPFATIAKLNALLPAAQPGDAFLLAAGRVFRDDYIRCNNQVKATSSTTLATNPPACSGSSTAQVLIGSYGVGAQPIVDAADPLNLNWTLVTGTTWQATPTATIPTKLYMDNFTSDHAALLPVPNCVGAYSATTTYQYLDCATSGTGIYVHGPGATTGVGVTTLSSWVNLYNPNSPAQSQIFPSTNTGLQNVEAGAAAFTPSDLTTGYVTPPGLWWTDGSNLFVNLTDGSNPNSHTFEGTQRNYGYFLSSANNVTVSNITFAHAERSCMLAFAYSNTNGSTPINYPTNEYNQILSNTVFNCGDSWNDPTPFQGHTVTNDGGIILSADGSYTPHLLRGDLIANNTVGTVDSYFGLYTNTYQIGVGVFGVDGGGAANQIIVANNFIKAHNTKGLVWSTQALSVSSGVLLNNGGRVTGNEFTDNQGNLFFTSTAGGMEDHNKIHDTYGEGVQSGGASTSTASVPQTHSYDLVYNFGKGASAVLYNGFDCNSTSAADNIYWDHNTIVNTYSNAMTFENTNGSSGGCTNPHVTNSVMDQNELAFPQFTTTNGSNMFYYVDSVYKTAPGPVFNNNIYVFPSTSRLFAQGKASSIKTCALFLTSWPDTNSVCASSAGFVNARASDFRLAAGSPAIGAGTNGTNAGYLDGTSLFFYEASGHFSGTLH